MICFSIQIPHTQKFTQINWSLPPHTFSLIFRKFSHWHCRHLICHIPQQKYFLKTFCTHQTVYGENLCVEAFDFWVKMSMEERLVHFIYLSTYSVLPKLSSSLQLMQIHKNLIKCVYDEVFRHLL